ncbi:unnamed protein product [Pieris brassicae]|uniref:unspecific monooxygenase n=1 Tax=Pieris brassicae TaxID=7116 RepID=A0A9P0XL04_PIEBR|nr:unnamed protein product [Pieris brassicae]
MGKLRKLRSTRGHKKNANRNARIQIETLGTTFKIEREPDLSDKGTISQAITDDVVISDAAAMLLGGFETSGSALTFTLYHLAYEPDIQQKIYEEVSKIYGQYGKFEISTLLELNYLNSVIKETLRLYLMGWLDRIPSQDYQIDDKLTIKKGTPVYVNAIGMQYDHNFFPEPLKYDPERFVPGNEENIKPFTYLPFGEGPRICVGKQIPFNKKNNEEEVAIGRGTEILKGYSLDLKKIVMDTTHPPMHDIREPNLDVHGKIEVKGMRFGLMSVRLAISNLILKYKFEPIPGAPKPTEVELETKVFFLVPGQHMAINFIPRNL